MYTIGPINYMVPRDSSLFVTTGLTRNMATVIALENSSNVPYIFCQSGMTFSGVWCRFFSNPSKAAVPLWGQSTPILGSLSPKRDCDPKRVSSRACAPPHLNSAS